MASSSTSRSWRYDVFPSFSGEDVRKTFLSHLLEKFKLKLIDTFIDNDIERSRSIAPELLSAIRESRISIVVLSKKYASSTWCLNELVEIHECFKGLGQMVIPVFYEVDPSHVRKQTDEFGKVFDETCKGKTEDLIQSWKSALAEVASIAGYDFQRWHDEANMIEQISSDVSNKLFPPTDDFGDFVGIDAHIEAMSSILCLESKQVRMVGIVGPSGIGKSTIARALYSRISRKFHHWAFLDKRTIQDQKIADFGVKLHWAKQFLSEILGQKEIKIDSLGVVKQRLKHKKVLIVLDDVDDIDVLETLVEQTGCFGSGSKIIVVTQDRQILKSHEIDLIYEVEFPSRELALQMFCRSAFRRNSPPDGFVELAVEVTELAGNLPLGLNVLGSSLRGRIKEQWVEMMPRLQNNLNGKIEKTLRVSYDGLHAKDQDLFLYIACLLNGDEVKYIIDVLGESVKIELRMLVEKSLICIASHSKTVEMHNLLQMFGRDIVRSESIYNPGKRRFLMDAEDICDVFNDNTGTETVLGVCFNTSEINEPLVIYGNSFKGMRNLQFIKVYRKERWEQETGEVKLNLPQGLVYLPRKLRLLHWDEYPAKNIPSNFTAKHLVKLEMKDSKLEKLWEGTLPLGNLRTMNMTLSKSLKEIPDLSKATNLEKLYLSNCTSLLMLPTSIQHLHNLRNLNMVGCTSLEVLPTNINLVSVTILSLVGCTRLNSFPQLSTHIKTLYLGDTAIEEVPSWIENIAELTELSMKGCSKLRKVSANIWNLKHLEYIDFTGCGSLTSVSDLVELNFSNCTSLVMLPSSVQHLHNLTILFMFGCTSLEVLPTNINLVSLTNLDLKGCSRLTSFPQLSTRIKRLDLDDTGIEEVPSWIENITGLKELSMIGCKKLRKISATIWNLKHLEYADFRDCGNVASVSDASLVKMVADLQAESIENYTDDYMYPSWSRSDTKFIFHNCFNLDRDAQEFILQSECRYAVLPIKQVPTYLTHRTCGSSLSVPLPQSSLSQENLGFKACFVLDNRASEFFRVIVHWKIRGVRGMCSIDDICRDVSEMDHLVVFNFNFCCPREKIHDPPSQLDSNNMEFEFEIHSFYQCQCYSNYGTKGHDLQTCPTFPHGCGIRVLSVSPSMDVNDRSSETMYNHQSIEEIDVEPAGRSNELMRIMQMTVITSQQPSNIPELNLDLSSSLGGASSNFHGDGTSLFQGLCVDPMITEQQDTETLHCGSFLVSTTYKLFQLIGITFRVKVPTYSVAEPVTAPTHQYQ